MELWIRSQDKTKLCQARYFELDNDKTGIFCFNGESYSIFAGKYKTKERALEVLDEIQNILRPKITATLKTSDEIDDLVSRVIYEHIEPIKQDMEIIELSTYVYEMPKE